MADEQRALMATSTVLLFEELFDSMIEQEVQEMGNSDSDDALLIAVLGKSRFPLNRVRIVGYFEVVVPSYSPDCFRCHFRMSRESVAFLEGMLRVRPEMIPYQAHDHGDRAPVRLRKQILIIICMLANRECIRSVSDRFDIRRSTCCEVYMRVCTAITNNLAQRFIDLPERNDARNTIQKFKEERGFPGILGAIDGIHIPIQAPFNDSEQYIST